MELPQKPDPARGQGRLFELLNDGNRLLTFDYTREPGRSRLMRLLSRADVLVEGFRPGLLEKRGLGPKELLSRFPRLVYASISGYGSEGPRWAGHDLNYQALAGPLEGGRFPVLPAGDVGGALWAAVGVLAALRERDLRPRKRLPWRRRRVDVSMRDAAASLDVLAHGLAGTFPWWSGASPFYRLYECRDGRHVAVGALEKGYAIELLRRLGLERLEPLAEDPERNAAELARALEETFRTRGRDDWAALLQEREVCVTSVLTRAEAVRRSAAWSEP